MTSSLEFRPNSIDFLSVDDQVNSRIKCVAQGILSLEGLYGSYCRLTGLDTPSHLSDAVTKSYVDTLVSHSLDPLAVFHILNTTPSTSDSTGALIVDGGAGIKGAIFCGDSVHCKAIYTTSDARLKQNISKIGNPSRLTSVSAYEYEMDRKHRVGLLAQELVKAGLDNCVHFGEEHLGVDYQAVTALLVSDMNLLYKRIAKMENSIIKINESLLCG